MGLVAGCKNNFAWCQCTSWEISARQGCGARLQTVGDPYIPPLYYSCPFPAGERRWKFWRWRRGFVGDKTTLVVEAVAVELGLYLLQMWRIDVMKKILHVWNLFEDKLYIDTDAQRRIKGEDCSRCSKIVIGNEQLRDRCPQRAWSGGD